MIKLECKDCTKRYVGCHSVCENYNAWKKEHDELVKKQRKIMSNEYISFTHNSNRKRRKRHE